MGLKLYLKVIGIILLVMLFFCVNFVWLPMAISAPSTMAVLGGSIGALMFDLGLVFLVVNKIKEKETK